MRALAPRIGGVDDDVAGQALLDIEIPLLHVNAFWLRSMLLMPPPTSVSRPSELPVGCTKPLGYGSERDIRVMPSIEAMSLVVAEKPV